mmetsp:Transcript_9588/g.11131  ORF Transcript_9588/g.11131 Transcript_9588/m.11131 type:complete len:290 (-) Transcript_9588:324-1193(-)|eukprot:CAMPEP_0197860462 /NCGR_PEP_ID=MMETSP1438-20131217/35846_1 /TAXON_ID=1461541 /ORGANISM="Pterosperma sp., Strain CCMP1384" /LENGTH=289 /DNA_ID=CAMNT_0043477331 /DNA_START=55 /DNA_END=924 /DNA_ORIENTATION=+
MVNIEEYEEEEEYEEDPVASMKGIDSPESFQNLLQEAAKLKSAQLDYKRRDYVAAPHFFQETLHPGDEVIAARKEEFSKRLEIATAFKKEGNEHFGKKEIDAAVPCYTKAIAVFRYWEDDSEDRICRDFISNNSEEMKQVEDHLHACLTNTAQCLLNQENWAEAKQTCDMALKLKPDSVKALYRRAMCHIGLERQGGTVHLDMAVSDLKAAAKLDPQNTAVRGALKKYSNDKKTQDRADGSTFGGMFGRGELYKPEDQRPTLDKDAPPFPGAVKRNGLWYAGEDGRLLI